MSTVNPAEQIPNAKPPLSNRLKSHIRANAVFYIIMIIGAIYLGYMHLSSSQRLEEAQEAFNIQAADITAKAQVSIDINNQEALGMGMQTLVWAIRTEMLNENYEQVNQYILQLIKKPNIGEIAITDETGIIKQCSNKKHEQEVFANIYNYDLLQHNDIAVEKALDGQLYLIAPIMSFNSRLGYIFIIYRPSATMYGEATASSDSTAQETQIN